MAKNKLNIAGEQNNDASNVSRETGSENTGNDQQASEAPKTGEPAKEIPVPVPVTLDSLQAAATAKQQEVAKAMQENPSDFTANMKLMVEANKAMKAIQDFINAENQKELQAKLEAERKEKVAKVDTLLALHDALNTITASMPPFDQQTDEQKAQVQGAYDARKAAYTEICDIVAGSKPKVIHLKEGASGEGAVKRGVLGQQIEEKYKEYLEAGKTDAEARKALIKDDGFNDGTMGAVVRAYRLRTGLQDA